MQCLIFICGVSFTAYQYPELRREPKQLFYAMIRGLRCVYAGFGMAKEYLQVSYNQLITKVRSRLQRSQVQSIREQLKRCIIALGRMQDLTLN
jgi:hypothetical protein